MLQWCVFAVLIVDSLLFGYMTVATARSIVSSENCDTQGRLTGSQLMVIFGAASVLCFVSALLCIT